MTKDIVERLQMVADIEDASSIPPEFLDNAFFKQIMKDAISVITSLRLVNRGYETTSSADTGWHMYSGIPGTTGIGTQNTTTVPLPYTTYPTTVTSPVYVPSVVNWQPFNATVSQTMIYSEMDKERLAAQAVERAMEQAAAKDEPPPTVEEKDRLWDLIKSSVEGGG